MNDLELRQVSSRICNICNEVEGVHRPIVEELDVETRRDNSNSRSDGWQG